MQAVILAGGKGSRLKEITKDIPKPLVPIGGKPVIAYLLQQMSKTGVTDVIMAVNHQAEQIEQELGDGSDYTLKISYSQEEQELSTIAPLKLINNLTDTFIVANGDILTDLDFLKLFEYHRSHSSDVTVCVKKRIDKIDYGVLETNDSGTVQVFREKPDYSFLVSCGIYVFSKSVLDIVPDNELFGFDHLMYAMLKSNRSIQTYQFDGFWLDIGRPEDYEHAQTEYKKIL
ncbi:MAG: nucleotidyltransferase family protein [Calditrichaeota bacterium]|nr:MAG: nucleotidyltransferase family protein [Calditrichota bacterium]